MIGKTISHYKILEKLGEGGMGLVYKAEDKWLKRTVALKFLSPEYAELPKARERFIREAQAASSLDHPNICTIHEIDETDDHIFIVMAYVEGLSLEEMIDAGPLNPGEAIDIAIRIAEGLREAHDKGIVHRDIKSANIMMTGKGHPRIMDFGIAKFSGKNRLTGRAAVMGTTGYMSPEQARGKDVDHRTDIWSLGVVLYEMLTGMLPFKDEDQQTVIYRIANEEPEPISNVRDGIPPALERVVQKVLSKDPGERYGEMSALIADLRTVKVRPDVTRLPSERVRTTKLILLNQPYIRKLAMAAIAVAAALAVLILIKRPETDLPPDIQEPAAQQIPSIAVLPFTDLSPDGDQEYFCDGLTEELINALARLRGVKVVARTSCFAFKGEERDIRDIGKKLNVATVLEGSVQKIGKRLRINAQLIDVSDGYHIWAEKYDRDIGDIFALHDQLTLNIVNELKLKPPGRERTRLVRRQTENIEAYKLYLKGRWFWHKFTDEDFRKAIDYFEQATEKDPNYAAAYAGIADSYGLLPGFSRLNPNETFPKAKEAVLKALAIDDTLAESHTSLAWIKMQYDWDFEGAEREFKRAIELNPGYSIAHAEYALFLMYMGRSEEAIREEKRALELDPLSLIVNTNAIWIYFHAGRYDDAMEAARKTFEMDPTYVSAHHALGSVYMNKGMIEEAFAEFQKERELTEYWNPMIETQFGGSYARVGKMDEARKVLEELLKRSEHEYIPPYFIASMFIVVGDVDSGLDWLERAHDERDYYLLNMRNQLSGFDFFTSNPRFTALMDKMDFQQ